MKKLIESVNEDWRKTLASGALATSLALGGANATQADTGYSNTRTNTHSHHHTTRGMRDNNPTNVHHVRGNWKGEIGDDKDGEARFDNIVDGFRAGVKNFLTHRKRNPGMSVEQYLRGFANTANREQFHHYVKNLSEFGIDIKKRVVDIDPIGFVCAQSKAESSMDIPKAVQDNVRAELGL